MTKERSLAKEPREVLACKTKGLGILRETQDFQIKQAGVFPNHARYEQAKPHPILAFKTKRIAKTSTGRTQYHIKSQENY